MSTSAPVLDIRNPASLTSPLTAITLTGSGVSGSIPSGSASAALTFRLYNNYANASGVADATNCVLAAYDDNVTQGSAATTPVQGAWLQVQCLDYNGSTTTQDTVYFPIGGTRKHAVPVNSGTISGTGANYLTCNLQVVIPSNASGSSMLQGLWLENNFNL